MKIALDAFGKHLDCARLGKAGRTFDQQMPVGKNRDQQAFDEALLANNLGAHRLL